MLTALNKVFNRRHTYSCLRLRNNAKPPKPKSKSVAGSGTISKPSGFTPVIPKLPMSVPSPVTVLIHYSDSFAFRTPNSRSANGSKARPLKASVPVPSLVAVPVVLSIV